MEFTIFNEDYTFPILFSRSTIDYTNVILPENKDIRYRIYNYINIDDNVSLSLSSKALYLDMRNWFKLYLPSSGLEIVNTPLSVKGCHLCKAKSTKHTLFLSLGWPNLSVDRNQLFYLKQARGLADHIQLIKINQSGRKKYRFIADNYLGHKGIVIDEINKNTYSFALYPEEYQPSGYSKYSTPRILRACWKCSYLENIW